MQPNRVVKELVGKRDIEIADAFVLFSWDGKKLHTLECLSIEDEEELERFVLAVAKEGNDFLRRILKHRLENHGN